MDEAAEAEEGEGEERSITITISIFNSVVGAIIGRGGEKLTRIREVSQVKSSLEFLVPFISTSHTKRKE